MGGQEGQFIRSPHRYLDSVIALGDLQGRFLQLGYRTGNEVGQKKTENDHQGNGYGTDYRYGENCLHRHFIGPVAGAYMVSWFKFRSLMQVSRIDLNKGKIIS